MLRGAYAKARFHVVVEIADRDSGYWRFLLIVWVVPKLSVACNASKFMMFRDVACGTQWTAQLLGLSSIAKLRVPRSTGCNR